MKTEISPIFTLIINKSEPGKMTPAEALDFYESIRDCLDDTIAAYWIEVEKYDSCAGPWDDADPEEDLEHEL